MGTLLYRGKNREKKRLAVLQMLSTKFNFVTMKISSKNTVINLGVAEAPRPGASGGGGVANVMEVRHGVAWCGLV